MKCNEGAVLFASATSGRRRPGDREANGDKSANQRSCSETKQPGDVDGGWKRLSAPGRHDWRGRRRAAATAARGMAGEKIWNFLLVPLPHRRNNCLTPFTLGGGGGANTHRAADCAGGVGYIPLIRTITLVSTNGFIARCIYSKDVTHRN